MSLTFERMRGHFWAAAIVLLGLVALPAPGWADETVRPAPTARDAVAGITTDAVTHHRVRLSGRELSITATAGTLPLSDAKGERQASVFFVSYALDGAPAATRPLTFVFNGGPGASSAYLHIGALGPRVLDFAADGGLPTTPAQLVDNPDGWLDLTDLVFIDPVGTGYSRTTASGEEATKPFYGVKQDLQALAAVIDRYVSRNARSASPKVLVGESYGGFRAARLPQLLASDHGINISAVMLISPVLEFSLMNGDEFTPLPYALRLPAYAAVALERAGRLNRDALREIEGYALGEYLSALAAAPREEARMGRVFEAVARLTGLPQSIVERHDGRVPLGVFVKEARRGERMLVSRYDGSFGGPDPYPDAGGQRAGDPILDGSRATYSTAMVGYLRDGLGVMADQPYQLLSSDVGRRWEWRSGLSWGQGYVGAGDALREALALDPKFRVIVAHGFTDLQTPYFASQYVIDHLPRSLTSGRVELKLYEGGHMMYMRPTSRAALRRDAATLYPEVSAGLN